MEASMASSREVFRAVCFFFQAEDGIRDIGVTGVQTCALPISALPAPARDLHRHRSRRRAARRRPRRLSSPVPGDRRMTEPYALTACDALERLRARTLSARELLDSCLKRIESLEPSIGAWVWLQAEAARARAAARDAGTAPDGALPGLP